jgi:hypothetical protein
MVGGGTAGHHSGSPLALGTSQMKMVLRPPLEVDGRKKGKGGGGGG